MKILILSDIHGNITALEAVLEDVAVECCESLILVGDIIDYGMHSNEVICRLLQLEDKMNVLCNIRGNHEDSIIREDYSRFSFDRGKQSAQHTRDLLNAISWNYITHKMKEGGSEELEIDGKRIFVVHGDYQDNYWHSITPEVNPLNYCNYDFVISGHNHLPHFFEKFVDCENKAYRNHKKISFVNPGSVGQPRNHNPNAHYAIWDTNSDEVLLKRVEYDITIEQNAFDGGVDSFYKERLELGI
ncbi:MAG: metallophosphoesterase family protein [Pseudobutyrivibrio sp.]|nr:metallophosphoesterase family protein [Pseudobutyrivibrio sp.]